ncbi:hypothetical protein GCM10023405_42500 [Streptomonospora salina]
MAAADFSSVAEITVRGCIARVKNAPHPRRYTVGSCRLRPRRAVHGDAPPTGGPLAASIVTGRYARRGHCDSPHIHGAVSAVQRRVRP